MKRISMLILLIMGMSGATFAAELGDPAGKLVIKHWVRGDAIDVTDGKAIYVVEFWTTWSELTKAGILHMTELQKQFKEKNVVFIGVSDEPLDVVEPFVAKVGEKMSYIVACDDDRQSVGAYMAAYGQNGFPHAFIVKEGKMIWHGDPMQKLDQALEAILAGTYDVEKARKADQYAAELYKYYELIRKGQLSREMGEKLFAAAGDDIDRLLDLAQAVKAVGKGRTRDFELAETILDKAARSAGDKNDRVLSVRATMRFESGKKEEGLVLIKQAIENASDERSKEQYMCYKKFMEEKIGQNNQ